MTKYYKPTESSRDNISKYTTVVSARVYVTQEELDEMTKVISDKYYSKDGHGYKVADNLGYIVQGHMITLNNYVRDNNRHCTLYVKYWIVR